MPQELASWIGVLLMAAPSILGWLIKTRRIGKWAQNIVNLLNVAAEVKVTQEMQAVVAPASGPNVELSLVTGRTEELSKRVDDAIEMYRDLRGDIQKVSENVAEQIERLVGNFRSREDGMIMQLGRSNRETTERFQKLEDRITQLRKDVDRLMEEND